MMLSLCLLSGQFVGLESRRCSMRYSKRRQVLATEVDSKPQLASLSFEKALNAFLQVQDSAGHSRVTRADYKTVVGLFLRYMTDTHGYSCVDEITESDLLGWLAHLRNSNSSLGTPYSTRTIATYCRDVLTFFHWLIDHKYLQVDPTLLINEPKVEKALIRVFTDEELKMLDAACDRAPSTAPQKWPTTGASCAHELSSMRFTLSMSAWTSLVLTADHFQTVARCSL